MEHVMKILVIDCDARTSQTITQLLVDCPIHVATDAAAGLERIAHAAAEGAPYDLVFCELAMKDLDGTTLLDALRRQPQAPVCVLMSGYERIVEAALLAEEVLLKPLAYVEVEELVDRVRERRTSAITQRIRVLRQQVM
jgi:CheY-like chemotaxis protein